jgi:hypothetical protein
MIRSGSVGEPCDGVDAVDAGAEKQRPEHRRRVGRHALPTGEGRERGDGADAGLLGGGLQRERPAQADTQHTDAVRIDLGPCEQRGEGGAGVLDESRAAERRGRVRPAVAPVVEQQDMEAAAGEEVGERLVGTDVARVAVDMQDGGGALARGEALGGHEPRVQSHAVLRGDPHILGKARGGEGLPRGPVRQRLGRAREADGSDDRHDEQTGHDQHAGHPPPDARPCCCGILGHS